MIEIIYGSEPYLKDDHLKKILSKVDGFSLEEITDWTKEAENEIKSLPMFGGKKTVIYRPLELKNEEFLKFIKSPPDNDVYVIPEGNLDKRTAVYRELKKNHKVRYFNKIDAAMMEKFVMRELRDLNCRITGQDYGYFMERCNYWENPSCSMYTIKIYLRQLSFLGSEISRESIQSIVPETLHEKMFQLTNYILDKDGARLFKLADYLLRERESPVAMLSAILRTYRIAYKASLFPEASDKELEKMTGVKSYCYKKATLLGAGKLKQASQLLQEAVNQIKEKGNAEIVFRLTIAKLYDMASS